MPVVIALLLGAFGAYLWFDRRRDARASPQLPPGEPGTFIPTMPPVTFPPQGTVQPVILPGEVSAFVQQGNASNDPRIPLLLADALNRSGYGNEAGVLRNRALEILNVPVASRPQVSQSLSQMPLELAFAVLTGVAAGTPASLNRAAWIARSQNQPGLAALVQQRNTSPNNTQNFDFTVQDLLALSNAATASTDPVLKLSVAEILDRYPIPILGPSTGPTLASSFRAQVLQGIPQTQNVALDSRWLTMMSALPLSYQNVVLTMIGTGDPQAKERAATIASNVATQYGGLIRSL